MEIGISIFARSNFWITGVKVLWHQTAKQLPWLEHPNHQALASIYIMYAQLSVCEGAHLEFECFVKLLLSLNRARALFCDFLQTSTCPLRIWQAHIGSVRVGPRPPKWIKNMVQMEKQTKNATMYPKVCQVIVKWSPHHLLLGSTLPRACSARVHISI